MNKTTAKNFSEDIRKQLTVDCFSDTIYLSIRNVGTRAFKNCKCDRIDGWLFIWTGEENFYVEETELGDFVFIDASEKQVLT